ncbi:MAG: glutamate racemase [Myxococcales bacterium]|nr:glutamate racemase [Myxococcales bacterium]
MAQSMAPIGVFDSGFGGLTVFRRIVERLPAYDYLYLGDTARTPYGNRSFEAVLRFTRASVEYLFEHNCPLVIIACNTASAKALRTIQQRDLPARYPERRVLGVIRPTVEAIAARPECRAVALWATQGTVRSESFRLELARFAPGVRLVQQACPLLVPLIEAGELAGPGLEFFLQKYWRETIAQDAEIDTLLLACTHYPLIAGRIREVVPERVRIVSQDELIAPSLEDYLRRHPEMEARLSRGGARHFFTTDISEHFDELARAFLGAPVQSEKIDLRC